jgi:acetolactate synthase I/II/III large subunit
VPAGYYTTSTAFLEALAEAGVSYVFTNLGNDHPGLIESYAQAKAQGREREFPKLIVCPHETVALSAAHAYASVTRQPQAVVVHVDGGTQNLGGEVSNAMRGLIPVLIFAGASPSTLDGELPGSRNEFIHWLQDARDQRGILRGFVKYDNEIRTGRNVKQLVHRALQIARSDPAGPVYLVGPREVMEEPLQPYQVDPSQFRPVEPAALTAGLTREIATALARARHPLIVTSYLGRNPRRTLLSMSSTSTRCDPRCPCGRLPRGASPRPTPRWPWRRSPGSFGMKIWPKPRRWSTGERRSPPRTRRAGPRSTRSSSPSRG